MKLPMLKYCIAPSKYKPISRKTGAFENSAREPNSRAKVAGPEPLCPSLVRM